MMVKTGLSTLFALVAMASPVLGSPTVERRDNLLRKRSGCAYDPVTDSFTVCPTGYCCNTTTLICYATNFCPKP
ncbi:hypothetical protein DL96DRAFT_1609706 [Flagelloscypha sp. PMI_526]|nr:hypothetical protein DL96DRAFT_1609706 [Flagelloscypha sp. PMI_526]